ncbi:SdrD B-like domain-containing protein [Lewinella sp. W8]|uniref:DUF7619 domain-containing protein n=1 Tax=Lewinella sp. W8 TaxID=2528208 RepID=UPI0010686519|nr:SdrD B-like domain-containing protein [Lewinella sp. W8]MTB51270.1 hypothetical protein [Lewinella sp. W8]
MKQMLRWLAPYVLVLLGTQLSAQCNIIPEITAMRCADGGSAYFVDVWGQGTGDSSWFSPEFNQSGLYGDTVTFGPVMGSDDFFARIIDESNRNCARSVSAGAIGCAQDSCANIFVEAFGESTGQLCEQVLPVRVTIEFARLPATVVVVGALGGAQRITNGNEAYFEVPGGGEYTAFVEDAVGCVAETFFEVEPGTDCGSIGGITWLDENADGIRQAGEPAMANTVRLFYEGDLWVTVPSTGANGEYFLEGLLPGNYVVEFEEPTNPAGPWQPTLRNQGNDPDLDSDADRGTRRVALAVAEGDQFTGINVGWVPQNCIVQTRSVAATCAMGGVAWAEYTGSGELDSLVWNTGERTDTIESLIPGIYSVIAYFSDGCVADNEVVVVLDDNNGLEVSIEGEFGCSLNEANFLAAVVTGGRGPYTFDWGTPGLEVWRDSILPSGLLVQQGFYDVTVSNSVGCVGFDRIQYLPGPVLLEEINIVGPDRFPCDQDSIVLSVDSIPTGYTISWFDERGETYRGDSITVGRDGTYFVQASPENDSLCLLQDDFLVLDPRLDGGFTFDFERESCGEVTCLYLVPNEVFRVAAFNFSWTGPDGPLVDSSSVICVDAPGEYSVVVSSECGIDTLFYFLDLGAEECRQLGGTLWLDQAGNCSLDQEDLPVPGRMIEIREVDGGESYFALSGPNGGWSTEVPLGEYEVFPIVAGDSLVGNCDTAMVQVTPDSQQELDLFLPSLGPCPRMTTSVAIPFLRRCFPNTLFVEYRNEGTATAVNPELRVQLDHDLIFLDASLPVTQNGQELVFVLDSLPPFATGVVAIMVEVDCSAILGQSHCVEATATPNFPCVPESNWSGGLVSVAGTVCNGDSLTFLVENIGEFPLSAPLSFVVVEDGIMMTARPLVGPVLDANGVFEVNVPANGSTYQIIAEQEPNAPGGRVVSVLAEGCGENNAGSFSTGFANILPLRNGNPGSSVACRENVGAYDPNDKRGFPLGWDDNNIEPGTRIDYAIRFQNTGTDTAFTVIIRDTIGPELDLASLRLEAASHPYSATVDSSRVLTITFENILLPDSSTNLAGSQGVVNFSIDHAKDLERGDLIFNQAAIYFDFNEPIITNRSRHRLATEPLPTSILEHGALLQPVTVYPNPGSGMIQLSRGPNGVSHRDQVLILDVYGREVARRAYGMLGSGWDLRQLGRGYYLLLITDGANRIVGRTSFVITP